MPVPPDVLKELEATWKANQILQRRIFALELLERGKFSLELVPPTDDPPIGGEEFQAELRGFNRSLTTDGIEYSQLAIAMDAADALGFPLPEYIIPMTTLATASITALAACVVAWIKAQAGRKVRLRVGEVEAEAGSLDEIDALFKRAAAIQQELSSNQDGDDKARPQ